MLKVEIEFWDDRGDRSTRVSGGFKSDERAMDDLDGVASDMESIGQKIGGRWARGHHKHKNPTGNLERSTDAYLVKDTPSEAIVDLKPLAEYGIYVARMGLLDMDPAGQRTEAALDRKFDKYKT